MGSFKTLSLNTIFYTKLYAPLFAGIPIYRMIGILNLFRYIMTINFYTKSENFLTYLADKIEKIDKNSLFDVEYSDGILNITIDKTNQQYVINRHNANQKIWYSSPFSGADYFSFDEKSQNWLDDSGFELETKLFKELELI